MCSNAAQHPTEHSTSARSCLYFSKFPAGAALHKPLKPQNMEYSELPPDPAQGPAWQLCIDAGSIVCLRGARFAYHQAIDRRVLPQAEAVPVSNPPPSPPASPFEELTPAHSPETALAVSN